MAFDSKGPGNRVDPVVGASRGQGRRGMTAGWA